MDDLNLLRKVWNGENIQGYSCMTRDDQFGYWRDTWYNNETCIYEEGYGDDIGQYAIDHVKNILYMSELQPCLHRGFDNIQVRSPIFSINSSLTHAR